VSRWLVRRQIESLALIFAWSAALVAVALLWDSTAAFVAIFGSGYGAAIVYQAARHRWWIAGGLLAFGGGILLNIVTAGNHSRIEHKVVFAVTLVTSTYFLVAGAADRRALERSGTKLSNQLSDDGP
jgi:hypothetical protein